MIDEVDKKIINVLNDHGDASTRDISDLTGIPASTVHQRKQRLEENNIIQRYTVDIDWSAIGHDFTAYVVMTVDLSQLRRQGLKQSDLVASLESIEEVENAVIVTGSFDIILFVRAANKHRFNDVLQDDVQALSGVSDTTTLLVLDE